jgi:hypothetical protein
MSSPAASLKFNSEFDQCAVAATATPATVSKENDNGAANGVDHGSGCGGGRGGGGRVLRSWEKRQY